MELAKKSTDKTPDKGRGVGSAVNAKATPRRTDRVTVLPWSGNRDAHLLSLMLDVTRQVSALHDAVTDMRQEHKLNYRQLKRQLLKLSSDSLNSANRPTHYDSGRQHTVHSGTCSVKHANKTMTGQMDSTVTASPSTDSTSSVTRPRVH